MNKSIFLKFNLRKIILLLFLIISGCRNDNSDNSSSDAKSFIKIDPVRIENIKMEEISFTMGGYYPKVSGFKNKEFENNINTAITNNVNNFINDWSEYGDIDGDVSFEVMTFTDSIISIMQNFHGMVVGTGTSAGIRGDVAVVNADLKNEILLTNEHLNVKDIGVSNFNQTIYKFFKKVCEGSDMYWADYISNPQNLNDLIKLDFAIKDGNLVEVEFACPCSFATKGSYLIPIGKINSSFQVSTSNVNLPLSAKWDTSKIISEFTNGKFNNKEGKFIYKNDSCSEEIYYSFDLIDLNNDGYPEIFRNFCCSEKCFGVERGEVALFLKNNSGQWEETNSWTGFPESSLGSINNGYKDLLIFESLSESAEPVEVFWRWNGKKYEPFFNKVTFQFTQKKKSKDDIDAKIPVRLWIEALGNKNFESAFGMMSPSLSKSYALFTSTKRYGGIEKTNFLSADIVSSSECNYVVVATYESYDPFNRDGKYTEKFNVTNCNGNWQITNIKNVSVEYYR